MAFETGLARTPDMTLGQKVWQLNWGLVLLIALLGAFGIAMLFSAANGRVDPWASRQLLRFLAGLGLLFLVALVDIRIWFRYAYAIYFVCLALLGAVEVMGTAGMGAQRWIDLKVIQLQPSELCDQLSIEVCQATNVST